jgi:putative acetyltransferase
VLRATGAGDHAAVDAVLRCAFAGPEEAELVARLRRGGQFEAEYVCQRDGRVVAYAGVSRMIAPDGWLALAPVAVLPEAQGQGIGSALVRALVETFCNRQGRVMVVLGRVAFYERAGFSNAHAAGLETPYGVAHMMLAGPGPEVPRQRLVYPSAFEGL